MSGGSPEDSLDIHLIFGPSQYSQLIGIGQLENERQDRGQERESGQRAAGSDYSMDEQEHAWHNEVNDKKDFYTISKTCSTSCGRKEESGDDYIVGGSDDVESFNQPWLAKLQIRKFRSLGYCSGSVINSRFILSASHCFCPKGWCKGPVKYFNSEDEEVEVKQVGSIQGTPSAYEYEAGKDYAYQEDEESYPELLLIEALYIHPKRLLLEAEAAAKGHKYQGIYDLALLKTDQPMSLDGLIKPICLPFNTEIIPPTETGAFQDAGVVGRIAGYGQLVNSKGESCLTNSRGKMRFHLCKDASLFTPCKMIPPPSPFDPNCGPNCTDEQLRGPYGWCNVRKYKEDTVDPADMWGFCSSSCVEKEITPSSYHEEAEVDVLSPERCSELLYGMFSTKSAPYNPELEICAGRQTFIDTRRKRETGHYLETPTIQSQGASNLSMEEELEKFKDGLIMRQTEDGEIIYININGSEGSLMEADSGGAGDRLTLVKKMDGLVGGTDACQGDSGGPLWVDWGNKATQIGVIARGTLCGALNRPGVYTRILPNLGWIHKVTSEHGCFTM